MPDGNKTMGGGKMTLEVTNLNFKNSFSVLSNEEIISISDMMGVHINDCDFSAINLIKDLEVARHSLEEKNKINMPTVRIDGPRWGGELGLFQISKTN